MNHCWTLTNQTSQQKHCLVSSSLLGCSPQVQAFNPTDPNGALETMCGYGWNLRETNRLADHCRMIICQSVPRVGNNNRQPAARTAIHHEQQGSGHMIIRFETIDHQNCHTADAVMFRALVTWVVLFSPAVSLSQRHVLVPRVTNYLSIGPYLHVVNFVHPQQTSG